MWECQSGNGPSPGNGSARAATGRASGRVTAKRQGHLEARSAAGRLGNRDRSLVGLGDPPTDRQSEPGTARRRPPVAPEPRERLEDPLPVGGWDARSLVADPEDRVAGPGGDVEPDLAALGRVGDGVVEEDDRELLQPVADRRSPEPPRARPRPAPRGARRPGPRRNGSCPEPPGPDRSGRSRGRGSRRPTTASVRRSSTSRPSRSASPMMSSARRLPSSSTRPSRWRTSAFARMIAAGVRSSCDASATKRRCASNERRTGTSARPVTRSVTRIAARRPARPTTTIVRTRLRRLRVVEGQHEPALDVADDRTRMQDRLGQEPDRDAAGGHGPEIPASSPPGARAGRPCPASRRDARRPGSRSRLPSRRGRG